MRMNRILLLDDSQIGDLCPVFLLVLWIHASRTQSTSCQALGRLLLRLPRRDPPGSLEGRPLGLTTRLPGQLIASIRTLLRAIIEASPRRVFLVHPLRTTSSRSGAQASGMPSVAILAPQMFAQVWTQVSNQTSCTNRRRRLQPSGPRRNRRSIL